MKLLIMDYSSSTAHLYDVNEPVDDDFVSKLGYKLDQCYWMCGKNIEVINHSNIENDC